VHQNATRTSRNTIKIFFLTFKLYLYQKVPFNKCTQYNKAFKGCVAPAKLKPTAANPPRAILASPDRAESKLSLGGLAGLGMYSGYELAVTSYTLVRARVPRGFRARGIFPKKSLSYAAGPLR
jgi:hypothetical protein